MTIQQLNLNIESNEKKLKMLYDACSDKIKDVRIRNQLKKVLNRSHEHQNGSFIVLIVGPVKSGKSTLVNLIAKAHVSPTHFLECTVRPSIISCNPGNQNDNTITTYFSGNRNERLSQFDSIIDYLRGQEEIGNIEGIKWESYPLSEENIRDKVQLNLHDATSDETLVTSIRTPGGKLLQEDIFVIDMPGFDGAIANMDNDPIYKCIAERADLIIFVQSSNSAISKVANDFLQILKNNNNCVPVCLIHNVFESAYWRDNDEKDKAAKKQLDYAYQEIKAQGFQIEYDNCHSINLGKVEDSRLRKYDDATLSEAAIEFEKIEQSLHEKVISNKDFTRLLNCYNRTMQNMDILAAMVKEKIAEKESLKKQYDVTSRAFDNIATDNHLVCLDDDCEFKLPLAHIDSVVQGLISNILSGIDQKKSLRTVEVREKVMELISECEKQLSSILSGKYIYSTLYANIVEREIKRLNEINKVVIDNGGTTIQMEALDFDDFKHDIKILLEGMVNVEHLVPHLRMFGKHNKEKVSIYLNSIRDILLGLTDPSGALTKSYLELSVIPRIKDQIESDYKRMMDQRSEICTKYHRQKKAELLSKIISDPAAFEVEMQALKKISDDLYKISGK